MRVIIIVLAIAAGIWLAFNYPDIAQQVLDYVLWGINYIWGLIQGAVE